MCKHSEVTIEVALILLYSRTYLHLGVSELEFGCSGVVNGLVCEVLVPRHFLNDTNVLFIIYASCTITWKSQLKLCSTFLEPNVPLFRCFRARIWAFWGGKRTDSWSIVTKALSE